MEFITDWMRGDDYATITYPLRKTSNTLIQEFYNLKPINESEIDKLFNEVQRISELYVRSGSEIISEKWLVAAVKRILFTKIAMDLALELRKLSTFDEIQSAINMYRHDHNTGLLRGMSGFMLAMIETSPDHNGNTTPTAITTHPHAGFGTQTNENKRFDTTNGEPNKNSEDLCAATKGGKAKGGTGYGQCWECGEYGHPRKECPKFIERMGGGKGGDVAALKGAGKKGNGKNNEGKWQKGKWNNSGNNNGGKGYGYNYYYPRSLGKGDGKGLNTFDSDYW